MTPRTACLLLALLLPALAHGQVQRSESPYPASAETMKGNGIEHADYVGGSDVELFEHMARIFDDFNESFGGVTFGQDQASRQPVRFEGPIEQAVLEMIRKAPEVAGNVREEGGILTAVFEFRPRLQPSNSNVYVRASWLERNQHFELRRIIDPADAALREDITGMHVEMGGASP